MIGSEYSEENEVTYMEQDEIYDENMSEYRRRTLQHVNDADFLPYMSMTELYDTVYTAKKCIIENLLYAGTYILAGAPKIGKSFLAAQLAYHVSNGLPIWGRAVYEGTVLYLALEDPFQRLQDRLYRMFGADNSEKLKLAIWCHPLGGGLEKQLKGFVQEYPDTQLIIVDVLQKVRSDGGDTYSYARDYEAVTAFKQMADEWNICILLIHHTRKMNSNDKFEMISGTNGIQGAADGALVLYTDERISANAVLDVIGRDQPSQRFLLSRNPKHLIWELEKEEGEIYRVPAEPELEAIAGFITKEHPHWEGTPSELLEELKIKESANSFFKKLNCRAGRLYLDYQIRYERRRTREKRYITLDYEQS